MSGVTLIEGEEKPARLSDQLINGAVIAGILAVLLVSHPRPAWVEAFAGLGPAAGLGVSVAAAGAILAFGALGNFVERGFGGVIGFAGVIASFAAGGLILALSHDLFARLGVTDLFVRAPGLVEFAAMGFGAGCVMAGLGLAVLLIPSVRDDEPLDLSRHDMRLLRVAVPVLIGEGVLISALALARLLDWNSPGTLHGVLLFVTGAAFLIALWFSAASFGKMDEHERDLTYRQISATFVVSFFLLAGWALVEAAGRAPTLDAFHGFLLLNVVYLGLSVPWTLWACRHDLK